MPSLIIAAGLLYGIASDASPADLLEQFGRRVADRLEAQVELRCSSIARQALEAQIEAMDERSAPTSYPASLSR